MTDLLEVISGILLLIGSGLMFTGALGVLRFPDTYSRMHAAGVTETLATTSLLMGLMLLAGWSLVLLKLIMILLFILFTSPTASHALAKAVWRDQQHKSHGEQPHDS
ncbi:monovalent cation/H(+) antiporter subunit G [Zhongshania sp.]|uniref:monovalent cation/H(+) antiporter subunit G n=1 Tax=Zhongshania sp. TaxID=1971902 RepID=UPI001B47FCD3|nr:monovalent cation/H(+) antiporter subunit G [Zhongshania sp.]MBQ0797009.1 monovalent cation/H(+) antiporter subunit G [Zhongshania sp.]|tara:strand:- start:440 stop:760 length:321 start_codon:yes stop_codon:yes gene_type:complete